MNSAIFWALPDYYVVVDVSPSYRIIDATNAYLNLAEKDRDIIGKPLFEVFPDSIHNNEYSGVRNLKKSFEKVKETLTTDVMGVLRYDVLSIRNNELRIRYWKPTNTPVFNDNNELIAIIHSVQDVTKQTDLTRQLKIKEENIQQQIADAVSTTQELERIEIGRELHDNVNQLLITAKLFLGRALTKNPMDSALAESGYTLIEKAIEDLKNVSSALLNTSVEEESFVNSIEEIIKQVISSGDFKIEKELNLPDETLIESKIKVSILRIIQEQMANIIQHAEAKSLFVGINFKDNILHLSIKDDGKGFNISEMKTGFGFHNMKSRVSSMKGTISIISSPGDGCRILVTIPMHEHSKSITQDQEPIM